MINDQASPAQTSPIEGSHEVTAVTLNVCCSQVGQHTRIYFLHLASPCAIQLKKSVIFKYDTT